MPNHQLSAVTIPAMHATMFVVNFSPATLPPSVDWSDWTIDEGVRLHRPDDLSTCPDGMDVPGAFILGKSLEDPKYYGVFRRPEDLSEAEFGRIPMTYGGVYSETHWRGFVREFPRLLQFLQVSDPDLPEFQDQAGSMMERAR